MNLCRTCKEAVRSLGEMCLAKCELCTARRKCAGLLGDQVVAQRAEIKTLRAELATRDAEIERLKAELEDARQIGAEWMRKYANKIDEYGEAESLRKRLAACAAGPWRPLNSAPYDKWLIFRHLRGQQHCKYERGRVSGPLHLNALLADMGANAEYAEIQLPEKGEADDRGHSKLRVSD